MCSVLTHVGSKADMTICAIDRTAAGLRKVKYLIAISPASWENIIYIGFSDAQSQTRFA
jgi:hypothetical protein